MRPKRKAAQAAEAMLNEMDEEDTQQLDNEDDEEEEEEDDDYDAAKSKKGVGKRVKFGSDTTARDKRISPTKQRKSNIGGKAQKPPAFTKEREREERDIIEKKSRPKTEDDSMSVQLAAFYSTWDLKMHLETFGYSRSLVYSDGTPFTVGW